MSRSTTTSRAQFAVCDRWFSSVPGATWPNRLYAICGRAAGSRDDLPHNRPPLYDQPSFVRHLDAHGISWRWYSFEVGTLRCADARLPARPPRPLRVLQQDQTELERPRSRRIVLDEDAASFLEDAARGHAAVGLLDRPELQQLQPRRLPAQRRPRAGRHQGRPGARARRLPRAGRRPAVGENAAGRSSTTSTAASSITSRRPAPPDDDPQTFGALRRPGTGAGRLAVGRARLGIKHGLRPHLDHQDDPAALLPGRARRSDPGSSA